MSKEKEFKRSEYLAAVKDLIGTMGLQDDNGQPLTIGAKSNADELKKFITDCMDQIDPETDKFDDATVAILESLGYKGFSGEVDVKVEEPATKPGASDDDDDWKEDAGKVLEAKIMSAKKLAELRQIINEESIFEDLVDRLGDVEFGGMQGPKNLKAEMLKMLNLPTVGGSKSDKAPKKDSKSAKPIKEPKQKKEKTEKKKGPGIISTIVTLIENAGKDGISKDEILQGLKKSFPDHSEDKMKATINVQVPARIRKERFNIDKTKDGRWFKK